MSLNSVNLDTLDVLNFLLIAFCILYEPTVNKLVALDW